MMSLPAVPPRTTWSLAGVVQIVGVRSGVSGLSRITSGVISMLPIVMPPVGSARPSAPRPVNCFVGSTSSVKAGVVKTSAGRCVASVFAMISLANELLSSSVPKFEPAVRSR